MEKDEVWRKGGYFYHKNTITAIDGEQVTLGNKEVTIDDLLPPRFLPYHLR